MKSASLHPVAKPLAKHCNRLHALGLTPGTSGQASVWDEDLLWFTPPGVSFRDLQPDQLIIACPDGRILGESSQALTEQLQWHHALYAANPELKAILVARPPKLYAMAQRHYDLDPHASTVIRSIVPEHLGLQPPASTDSRAHTIATTFPASHCLIEIGFGVILAADTLTAAINTLEELEACTLAVPYSFPADTVSPSTV